MDDRLIIDTQTDAPRGLCTIKLSGPLLVSNIQAFKNQLRDLEIPGLVIDLTNVSHVDSVGIGVLVNALMLRKKHGGLLVLTGVSERVMAVLKGTQVDQLFRFAASASEAQAMVSKAS
jgi:anti-sigma B factor antagonist